MGRDCQKLAAAAAGGGHGGEILSSYSKSKKKPNGCMAAFNHLFDFQHLNFPSQRNLSIDSPSSSKGEKLKEESPPPSTTYKDLNIPITMRVRTEKEKGTTSSSRSFKDSFTSSSFNSPSCNTPNLVARLMGLDLLPDTTHRLTSHKGTSRSLPESPRISSARKSDFDIHRFSLQHECSRVKVMKQDQESPKDYVKQIKERVVTKRVLGLDITNSVKKNREAKGGAKQKSNEHRRRDTTVSCSSRNMFSDKENKPRTIQKTNSSSSLRLEHITPKPPNPKKTRELRPIIQCNKSESETSRPRKPSKTSEIRNKPREAFLYESREAKGNHCNKKKSKKISKSNNDILETQPLQKQINETQRPKQNEYAAVSTSSLAGERLVIDCEREYITRVMKLAAINNIDSIVSSTPMINHSIFRELEHLGYNKSGTLALRCNRKMLFDLVNETLTKNVKRRRGYHGLEELLRELCSVVERCRHTRCLVPGEIASIEVGRLIEIKKFEEEVEEEIIAEIERDIIDALVHETVSYLRNKSFVI